MGFSPCSLSSVLLPSSPSCSSWQKTSSSNPRESAVPLPLRHSANLCDLRVESTSPATQHLPQRPTVIPSAARDLLNSKASRSETLSPSPRGLPPNPRNDSVIPAQAGIQLSYMSRPAQSQRTCPYGKTIPVRPGLLIFRFVFEQR